jgi:hypothetical protein
MEYGQSISRPEESLHDDLESLRLILEILVTLLGVVEVAVGLGLV